MFSKKGRTVEYKKENLQNGEQMSLLSVDNNLAALSASRWCTHGHGCIKIFPKEKMYSSLGSQ
jgi:hypothetical protein